MTPRAKSVEVEILPPEKRSDNVPRLIALFMDGLFALPGTKWKFGLNPFLDLIPVVGDTAAAVVSAVMLYIAAQYRVPKVVLARMGLNVALNSALGVLPGIGEAFAAWYRPNQRNYELLQRHIGPGAERASTATHWLFLVLLFAFVFLFIPLCLGAGVYVLLWTLHALKTGTLSPP